jgi:hypothetical protein
LTDEVVDVDFAGSSDFLLIVNLARDGLFGPFFSCFFFSKYASRSARAFFFSCLISSFFCALLLLPENFPKLFFISDGTINTFPNEGKK